MARRPTTVMYRGEERDLGELAREHGINKRTAESRIERGASVEKALRMPTRAYPNGVKRNREPKRPDLPPGLVADALDLLIDARGVIESLDATPRRDRILAGMRRWLQRAGWR